MAQPTDKDSSGYKSKLRNASSKGGNSQGDNTPNLSEQDPQDPQTSSKQDGNSQVIADESELIEVVEVPVISMKDFEQVDVSDKLNLLMSSINKINTNFHYKFDSLKKQLTQEVSGVLPRLKTVEKQYEELLARVDDTEANTVESTTCKNKIEALEQLNAKLSDDMALLKGLITVQDAKLKEHTHKIVDLTAHSMSTNVIISSIMGNTEDEANHKDKVLSFLRNRMKMEVTDDEVLVAHRLGRKLGAKPRNMVVRCAQPLRDRVFSFTKNLKDTTNELGDYYYVNPQLSELLHTERIEREEQLRSIRRANKLIPEDQKDSRVQAYIKNKTLIVNKVAQKQYVSSPTVQQILNVKPKDQAVMDAIQFSQSETISDKGSHFRGYATRVNNTREVKLAYNRLKQLYPESNHIMMAYSINTYSGCQDDGEFGASSRMLRILTSSGKNSVAVLLQGNTVVPTWDRGDSCI